ncbi:MAG: histidine phosphatase family protein [Dehalococcoidia bacterium]|nr:histidine phosphatase family protein [Dehalococcoidia bacterium]
MNEANSEAKRTRARRPSVFDQAFLTGVEGVTEVLLIRHAQQQLDPQGPVGEFFDPPLSDQGRLQARLLGEALSTMALDAIFSSNLQRAAETAREVARHHRLEPQVLEGLREVEVFRDVPRDQRADQFLGKELLEAVRQRMLNERSWDVYPYSEPSAEFRKRAINAVEQAIATHEAERIAIVCHGGVINAYVGHIIGSPYDMFFRPAHTAVSVVIAGAGQRVLRSLNDVHHLRTAEGEFHSY